MKRTVVCPMRYLLFAAVAHVLTGCGSGVPADGLVLTDSAGVEIVHHHSVGNEQPDLLSLADEPLFSIGSVDGHDALHRVAAASLLSDGSVVVLNSGTGEIRTYNRDGSLRRSFGRTGSGPGEFRAFSRVINVLPGDTIVVFDPRLRRATTIGPVGEPATTSIAAPSGAVTSNYIGRLPDGSHVVAHTLPRRATDVGSVFQDSVLLIRHGSEGDVVAEFARGASTEMTSVPRGGGMVQIMELPFGARASIHRGGTGILVAHNRANELRVYSFAGALERIIRRDDPVAAMAEGYRKAYPESAYPGVTLPDSLPPFDRVLVGSDHLVWLARVPPSPDGGMITWDALDTRGKLVARLPVPKELTVHQINEAELVASERDSMGVEYVRVYALAAQRN